MKKRCSKCEKEISIPDSLVLIPGYNEVLKMSPCVCAKCFIKEHKRSPLTYTTDQGRIEILELEAVTQEIPMRIACDECSVGEHVLEPLIFINCKFKYPDGKTVAWETGHIFPQKKYYCIGIR